MKEPIFCLGLTKRQFVEALMAHSERSETRCFLGTPIMICKALPPDVAMFVDPSRPGRAKFITLKSTNLNPEEEIPE
jgi:hypothetical protein